MLKAVEALADTLSQKPEVGIFGSVVGVALSPVMIISLISAILGLITVILTLTIKIMDISNKIKEKKRTAQADEIRIIEGTKYRLTKVQDEEEE